MSSLVFEADIVNDKISAFAQAAYRGDFKTVETYLLQDPSHKLDANVLYLTLQAGRKDMFKRLIELGVQIQPTDYKKILLTDESLLYLLPQRPELIQKYKLEIEWANRHLVDAIFYKEDSLHEIIEALKNGANPNMVTFCSHSYVDYNPLHLAAIEPKLEVLEVLLNAKADPSVLAPNDKNALRMILENPFITSKFRRNALKLFRRFKSNPHPELNLLDKINLLLGQPIKKCWPDRETQY